MIILVNNFGIILSFLLYYFAKKEKKDNINENYNYKYIFKLNNIE